MSSKIKPVDWGGIEGDYCAGVMSVREIARWYGVSHTAIQKRAKAKEWQRRATPGHVERSAPIVRCAEPLAAGDSAKVAERARELASRMVDELDAVTAHHGELEDMISVEESDPRRRGALIKAISLGERALSFPGPSRCRCGHRSIAPPACRAGRSPKPGARWRLIGSGRRRQSEATTQPGVDAVSCSSKPIQSAARQDAAGPRPR